MRFPILVCMMFLMSCQFLRGYASGTSSQMNAYSDHEPRGYYRLLFDDFQGLNTDTMQRSAVPWKLLGAALLLQEGVPEDEQNRARVNRLFQERFGFYNPSGVANSPTGRPVSFRYPMGFVAGTVSRSFPSIELEVVNTGCSTCHSSPQYGRDGQVTGLAWVGAPSSNVNLERYVTWAYQALREAVDREDVLFATIRRAFPEVSQVEVDSIQKFILPALKKRLKEVAPLQRLTPYSNGGAGITNGAATLQSYMGWLGADHYYSEQAAFTGVPSLAGLRLKRAVLCDGVYGAPGAKTHEGPVEEPQSEMHRQQIAGISSMVTMSTLGVDVHLVPSNRKNMREVVDYLFDFHSSPPFPGDVDAALADAGARVFENQCASCHGSHRPGKTADAPWTLVSFPNKVSSTAAIGTDPVRSRLLTEELVKRINDSPLRQVLQARIHGGYVAPPLAGIWATSPYFHNNSVPTLWHLMHPEQRPVKFEVGGHKLDFQRVGIAGQLDSDGVWRYPSDYTPWTEPEIYDTTSLGRSNQGHEGIFEKLDEQQKTALLEHLKRL